MFERIKTHTYIRKLLVRSALVFSQLKRAILIFACISIVGGPVALLTQTVNAAEITTRSLTISTAVPSATANYLFSFTPGQAAVVNAIIIQFCTSAVGSCTSAAGSVPTGLSTSTATMSVNAATFEGTFSGGTHDTTTTSAGTLGVDCTQAYDYCYNVADTTSQTVTNHQFTLTGAINPSTVGTFYARISTYGTTTYGTPLDNGNVAAATTQNFTVNATVQEELTFCIGEIIGNAATVETVTYAVPTCASMTGSSLNLGSLNSSYTNVSPVPTTQPTNGDNGNAVAELSSNAANGTTVSYNAIQASTGTNHLGSLRVAGATCSTGTSFTDQCINSLSAAAVISSGTEDFGMTVPGVNCYNVPSGAYTCNATTHNLTVATNYDCNASNLTTSFNAATSDAGGQITGSTKCAYMWDETGASNQIASSTSVVGGEALIIEFAATPEITTPTGQYSVQANYVATPTF